MVKSFGILTEIENSLFMLLLVGCFNFLLLLHLFLLLLLFFINITYMYEIVYFSILYMMLKSKTK